MKDAQTELADAAAVLASGGKRLGPNVADSDAVTASLERAIAERGLGPGDRLPTERELAEVSGTGRAAVRRALGVLEAQGRVIRHVGRGTFLAPPPDGTGDGTLFDASPIEIMAVRALLEPGLMPLAAVAANGSDFAEMERCLQGGATANSPMEWEAWDASLHRSLVVATHNTFLVRIGEMVASARLHPAWGSLKRRTYTPEHLVMYRTDHREIVDALVERNAEQAQKAMRRHLHRVRGHLLSDHAGPASALAYFAASGDN